MWWFICHSLCTWMFVHTWMLFSLCWSASQPERKQVRYTDRQTLQADTAYSQADSKTVKKSLRKPASQWLLIVNQPISQSVRHTVRPTDRQSINSWSRQKYMIFWKWFLIESHYFLVSFRLLDVDDEPNQNEYPLQVFKHRGKRIRCRVCDVYTAK